MPGPRPKPTVVKIREGNPSKRALPKDEPKPEIKIPKPPAHLSKEAKTEWRRLSKELFKLGLLSEIDRTALAAYCQVYGRWVQAEKEIEKTGWFAVSEKGGLYQTPAVSIANKCLDQMKSYLVEFGMTPSSRTRIKAEKPKDVSSKPWADL
jgi:P27 family predicted phage terminase small subunit